MFSMFEQAQIQEFKEVGVAVPSPDEGHPTGEMTCMPRLIQTVSKPLNKHLVLVTSIDYQKKKKKGACRPSPRPAAGIQGIFQKSPEERRYWGATVAHWQSLLSVDSHQHFGHLCPEILSHSCAWGGRGGKKINDR